MTEENNTIKDENKTTSTTDDFPIEEKIKILNDHLSHREKKLKDLSILLGDLNNDLNLALQQHQELTHEKKEILHKLDRKNELIIQERSDKKWIAEHIHKLERENSRLKEALNISLKKKQENLQIIENVNEQHKIKQKTLPKFEEESREESHYEPPTFQ